MISIDILNKKIDDFLISKQKAEHLNCITQELSGRAKEKISLLSQSEKSSALLGKLFSIKDNINIKGYPTTCASEILRNHKSLYDATAVTRIDNSGGLIVAKTNLDEFGMGSSNEFSIYGACKNPINTDYVPGGSSGGSAASVASGLVDVSLGSDTGGSVRQPASFCGIYGLKPTYGRVSRYGLTAFASSFDQIGILSRTLDDLTNTFECISGYDKYDNTSSTNKITKFDYCEKATNDYTIGIPKEFMLESIDKSVKNKMDQIIKYLKKNNFKIKEISIPLAEKSISAYYVLTTAEASSNLSRYDGVVYGDRVNASDIDNMYKNTRTKNFGEEVKRRIILGTFILSSGYYDSYYSKALKVRRLIKNQFVNAFEDVDLILTPTSPSPAFKIGEKIKDPVNMYLSDIFTVPMSLAGVPAMNIPFGENLDGLPIGIQFASNYFEENKIFSIAKFINNNI